MVGRSRGGGEPPAAVACPACGAEQAAGARFCANCGTRLPREAADRAVRKAVTIVFTDVAGFTGLAERFDPERLRRVMARYFEEMKAVVERHGGTVEKFIGDAVMAVFGVPQLHEDDAVRAVRAAVEMREALDRLNRDLERDWGVAIQVRTGVNTGEVATGGQTTYGLVLGDAVNVAARLEQAAGPQEILLGPATYRLVAGAVEAEPLAPMALKGKGVLVEAHRVVRLRPDARTRVRRFDTPLVGRADEHAALLAAFERAVAERTCHVVRVVGDAGVGKSRLLTELAHDVGPRARVAYGACPSYGDGITFLPVAEVIGRLAGVGEDDDADAARAKLASVLAGDGDGDGDGAAGAEGLGVAREDAEEVVDQVAELLGLAPAVTGSEELFRAVRKVLEAAARREPLVVVFEDVQWGQPTFFDLVEHIVEWVREAPLLVCCAARRELREVAPGWGEGHDRFHDVELSPLPPDDSRALVAELLDGDGLSPSVARTVVEVADGNPLYLEELVAMLLDDGLLRREGATWVAAGDLHEVGLPPSLQSLLMARLDRLAPAEREVVEVAAAVGMTVPRAALLELVDRPADEVRVGLRGLVATGVLRNVDGGPGAGRVAFLHPLVREAAYGSMSKEARADVHERYADWLERTQAEGPAVEEEVLGYHLERAFRCSEELHPVDDHARELALRAGHRLAAAGERAAIRGDVVAAANLLARAVALLPASDEARLGALPGLSEARMVLGDIEGAAAVLDEAFAEVEGRDDQGLRAHLVLLRATQHLFTDPERWAEDARAAVESAIPVFSELGDELGLARAWRVLGLVDVLQGRYEAGSAELDRAAAHAHRAADRREELESLSWLPLPLFVGPTPAGEGIARLDDVVARADGDRKVEATALLIRAALEAMLGRLDEARRCIADARAIFEDLGLRLWLAGAAAQLGGWVELVAGDPAAAEAQLRPGYDALLAMGETSWRSTVAGFLAEARYALGDLDDGERFAAASLEVAGSDDVFSQVLGRSVGAKVAARRGDVAGAEAVAREAVALADATDSLQLQGDALSDLAEVLGLAGRADEAADVLAVAAERYERKGNVVSAARARAPHDPPVAPGERTAEHLGT